MKVQWQVRPFAALDIHALHAILRLRGDVFVVEQRCIYPDVDGQDTDAWHVQGRADDGKLLAYARILPGTPPHIGRVVVHPDHRGHGLARALMHEAMQATQQLSGSAWVAVAAQTYLEPFYRSLGFTRKGPDYDWDGIPHVDMERPA